jgi:tetratricopeptide (TPR) repeat protein
MKRAETLLKQAFALRTSLVVQAYNKREWPMFLRGRGRYAEAEKAAQALVANPHPVVSATGHIEAGLAQLAQNRWGDAANSSNAALRLLRAAPGGALAAAALQTLQGEYHLRTADRAKGRATLDEAIKRLRSAPGPDPWSQALFELESIARTARAVGDWELAARVAAQMIEHDPSYAGSHYAVALARDHDGDAAGAKAAFAAAVKAWAGADTDLPELADAQRKSR